MCSTTRACVSLTSAARGVAGLQSSWSSKVVRVVFWHYWARRFAIFAENANSWTFGNVHVLLEVLKMQSQRTQVRKVAKRAHPLCEGPRDPRPATVGKGGAQSSVREIIMFGFPISDERSSQCLANEVQRHFVALVSLFEHIYGDSEAWGFLKCMLQQIDAVQDPMRRMQMDRMLLVYAVWLVPEVQSWYIKNDCTFVAQDLANRIMPFVGPRFLKSKVSMLTGL